MKKLTAIILTSLLFSLLGLRSGFAETIHMQQQDRTNFFTQNDSPVAEITERISFSDSETSGLDSLILRAFGRGGEIVLITMGTFLFLGIISWIIGVSNNSQVLIVIGTIFVLVFEMFTFFLRISLPDAPHWLTVILVAPFVIDLIWFVGISLAARFGDQNKSFNTQAFVTEKDTNSVVTFLHIPLLEFHF